MVLARTLALWRYRDFIWSRVRLEVQGRYKGSVLGMLWLLLQPMAKITIFTFVFSNVMRARLPGEQGAFAYSIFLCAGVLTWTFFTEVLGRCQSVFVQYGNLLKKSNFPRVCLPVIVVASSFITFAIIFALFLAFLVMIGRFPGLPVLAVLPVLAIQAMLGIGLGIALGTLHVFFRDVGQILAIVIQFWFWLTPIVYPLQAVPEAYRHWLGYNPVTPIALAYQDIFLTGATPDWAALAFPLGLGLIACAAGFALFRRHAGELVDEL